MINKLYIPVKVDRDERPDVDSRYQSADQRHFRTGRLAAHRVSHAGRQAVLRRHLFSAGRFHGPPRLQTHPAFDCRSFRTRRKQVDESAEALEQAIAKSEMFHGARGAFDPRVVESVIGSALAQFDETHGGFGQSPKFPHSSAIDLLLERAKWPGGAKLQAVAEKTLNGMAAGGFHDQIGGGFHRYSVDERWCVPHFEKMSYDNSELLKNYLHGYQVTGNARYREVAEGTIAWVTQVLSDQARGGFYASQDADQTLDDDGDYFTWTVAEAREVLSPDEWRVAELYYDIGPHGEMHHNPEKNVLWIAASIEAITQKLKLSEDRSKLLLASAKAKAPRRASRAPAHARRGRNALRRLERDVRLRVSRSRERSRAARIAANSR